MIERKLHPCHLHTISAWLRLWFNSQVATRKAGFSNRLKSLIIILNTLTGTDLANAWVAAMTEKRKHSSAPFRFSDPMALRPNTWSDTRATSSSIPGILRRPFFKHWKIDGREKAAGFRIQWWTVLHTGHKVRIKPLKNVALEQTEAHHLKIEKIKS